jgi:putative ABC transport system permease protein
LKGRAPRSGHRSRLRDSMVVTQLALSLTLLVSAALLARSFWRLMQVNPGFDTENVLTLSLRPNAGNSLAFYEQVAQRVSALPGVRSAGLISRLPLTGGGTSLNVFPVGPAIIPNDQSIQASWRLIYGDYFATMQIPLLRGQGLESLPPEQARNSIVISASLARALWGDTDPLGRQVNLGRGNNPLTIVGLVGDVRSARLNVEPRPSYYLSIHRFIYGPMALVVRSSGEMKPLVAALRHLIREIDPTVPLFRIRTMNEQRAESLEQERLLINLLSAFAAVALFLAALGTYGVVAFTVQQRTPEIGIRLAIGAQARDILRLILGQGLRLAAMGLVLGLAGAFAASRLMAALLYETRSTDAASYAIATVALAFAALLASLIPARRATKVDPMIALRAE